MSTVSGYKGLTVRCLFMQTEVFKKALFGFLYPTGALRKMQEYLMSYSDLSDVKFIVFYFFFNIDTFF